MAAIETQTLVICMIETASGVKSAGSIAAVEGVDLLHIGANDLLFDLGIPGDFASCELSQSIERVVEAAAVHGKWVGIGGDRDHDRRVSYIRKGIRFFSSQTDIAMLLGEATRVVKAIHAAAEEAGLS